METKNYTGVEIASSPQPPAGGEPEVLAWSDPSDPGRGLDWCTDRMKVAPGTELIDRAHFTDLQARVQAAEELLRRVVKSGVLACDPFEALEADCCAFLGGAEVKP